MTEPAFTSFYAPGAQKSFIDKLSGRSLDTADLEVAERILLNAPPAASEREREERNLFLIEGYQKLARVSRGIITSGKSSSRYAVEELRRQIDILKIDRDSLGREVARYRNEGLLAYLRRHFSRW